MSSHPLDPKPPVDIRLNTDLSTDDADFWDLDNHISNLDDDNLEMDDEVDHDSEAEKPKSGVLDKKNKRSALEVICSVLCYSVIIALFCYLGYYASKQHNFNTAKAYETNVPVTGEYASIASIETWWEKPTGNSAKYGVILVPKAKITLNEDSVSGEIRAVFYTSANATINKKATRSGDSANLEFRNGKFTKSGTNEITISGTDGFIENAHILHYGSQIEERWTIELRESAPNQTSTEHFKYLAKAPIEPLSK